MGTISFTAIIQICLNLNKQIKKYLKIAKGDDMFHCNNSINTKNLKKSNIYENVKHGHNIFHCNNPNLFKSNNLKKLYCYMDTISSTYHQPNIFNKKYKMVTISSTGIIQQCYLYFAETTPFY